MSRIAIDWLRWVVIDVSIPHNGKRLLTASGTESMNGRVVTDDVSELFRSRAHPSAEIAIQSVVTMISGPESFS